MDELLTDAERRVVDLLAKAAETFRLEVVAPQDGPTWSPSDADVAEFVDKVHQLQNAVLAQAAARAYPDRYRLLGRSLPR